MFAGPLRAAANELFSRPEGRFPALDGLRAIAALMIVCFHCVVAVELAKPGLLEATSLGMFQSVVAQWWAGVDVFFVLSGFLIGRILLTQLGQGKLFFRAFYVRRFFRIFPPYYVVLTLSVFVFAGLEPFAPLYRFTDWATVVRRSPADYLYITNYLFGGGVPHAMGWNWSLCIEEHFYLVLPAVLMLVFRWIAPRQRPVALAALALSPIAFRAVAFAHEPKLVPFSVWYGSHTHADGLLLGVLIAYFHVYHEPRFSRLVARLGALAWILGVACLALVFWAGGASRQGLFAVVLQFFVLAAGTGLLIVNGLYIDNRVSRFLAHPLWSPLAKISYGLYLVHLFPIFFLRAIWPGAQEAGLTSVPRLLIFTGAAMALSVLSATLLYFGVERGMIARGARLSRPYRSIDDATLSAGARMAGAG